MGAFDWREGIRLIYYKPDQIESLPNFFPTYNNQNASYPDLCESGVFYQERTWLCLEDKDLVYKGLLSWKFFQKTGFDEVELCRIYKKSFEAGVDAIVFNPFPFKEHCFANIWDHGEFWHPGIKEYFNISGLDGKYAKRYHGVKFTAFCNYVLGTPDFWKDYLLWLTPLIERIVAAQERGELAHKHFHHAHPLTYSAYFLERCLTTYLEDRRSLKIAKIDRAPGAHDYPKAFKIFDSVRATLYNLKGP